MSKRINEVVTHGDDVKKITRAIACAIDTRKVEDELRDLGLDVEVNEVSWGGGFATITIEGGENETGIILTLKLVKIEAGFDTLTIGKGDDDDQ